MAADRPYPSGSALMAVASPFAVPFRPPAPHGVRAPVASIHASKESNMLKPLMALLAASALLVLAPSAASAQTAPAKSYVVLDQSLSGLRPAFNANVGKVRML